jgi:hypothetical protein
MGVANWIGDKKDKVNFIFGSFRFKKKERKK